MSKNVVNEGFAFTLNIMRFAGLYLFDNIPKKIFLPYTWFIHLIFTVPVPILSIIYIATSNITSIEEISDNTFVTSEILIPIIKYIPLRVDAEKYKKLVETLNSPIFTSYSKQQEHFIKNTTKFIRRLTLFFFTHVTCTMSTILILPIFSSDRNFPIEIWLPFNPKCNIALYSIIYIIVALSIANCAYGNTALDILVPALYYHAATQLKILKIH